MTAARQPWTFVLQSYLRCSDSFVEQMDLQLRDEFAARTGHDLSGFVFGPETVPQLFAIRRSGLVGYVVGHLGAEGLAFVAAIAWLGRVERRFIEPTEQVTAEDVRFWWHVLPVAELVAEQATWPAPPFDVARFPFAIDYRLKTWPHVRFTISFHQPIDDARRAALEASVRDLVDDWLATGRAGTIHEAGTVTRVDARTVALDVDLGSAGPDGLVDVLERLAAFGGIARVQVRASGAPPTE